MPTIAGVVMPKKNFKNLSYKRLENEFPEIYLKNHKDVDLTDGNHITKVKAIFFELSNQCNYTYIHPECPTSCQKNKNILPSSVYFKTIDHLSSFDFSGVISFHRYNEPLIDPRLIAFLAYTRNKLPNARLRILTNGYYLTQEMVNSLIQSGLNWLEVSAYFNHEYERLVRINVQIPYHVFFATLDNRLDLYTRKPLSLNKPCYSGVNDVTVTCKGQLGLCCLDWKNNHTFGDLKKNRK